MGRHIQHADLSLPEWRKKAELHVEALNHALAISLPKRSGFIFAGEITRVRITAMSLSPT
jgi:hypothetical protein